MEQRRTCEEIPFKGQRGLPQPISLLYAARVYIARGWPVIPLAGKVPTVCWKELQSRLPRQDELKAWFFDQAGTVSGLGIVTGNLSSLVVVDCDSCRDAAYWQAEHGGSPLVVATSGGGVHFYYAMPKDVEIRNRAGVLSRKIDIRGEGGYATAPPSLHPFGKRYAFIACDLAAKLPVFNPDWIARHEQPVRLPCRVETQGVKNAIAYIAKIQAVSGEGGHNATFRAACKLRDAGLSPEEALAVLLDWNATNASPPWSEVELRHKIRSAYLLTK